MKGLNIGEKSKKLSRGYLFQRGKNYYCRFKLSGKQYCTVLRDNITGEPITNRKEAEKARENLLAPFIVKGKQQIKENILTHIKSDSEKIHEATKQAEEILSPALTLDKAWQAYLNNQERPQESGERNLKMYESYFNKFHRWIQSTKLDVSKLKEVTKETASEYALYMKREKLSPGTHNKHITFLKGLFHYLKEPARLEGLNPFESIKRLKDNPNTRREFSIEEIKIILDRASGDLQLLLGLGIFLGLRLGDACTLKWNEIDLITRSVKRIPNKTAKNKKAVIVGIPEILYQNLIQVPASQRRGYVLPFYAEKYRTSHSYLARAIQKHFTDCGIQVHRENTGKKSGKRAVLEAGYHSLRHSYISILAKQGVNQNILTKFAGHSSKMSELYTHIKPAEAHSIAQNAFAGILEPTTEAITVKPIPEATTDKNRIERALAYIKSVNIPEEIKTNILNIFGGG